MRKIFISTTILMGLSTLALAATSSVNPSMDTFLSATNPGNNYGAAGALEVSGSGTTNGLYDSIMMFNLAPVKSALDSSLGSGDWQVTGVSLQLTSASPNNSIFNANASGTVNVTWMQNDSWTEGTGNPMHITSDGITYSTLPSFQSTNDQSVGTIAAPGTNMGANTFSLTTSSGFLNDILTGSTATLLISPNDNTVSYLFNSENFTSTTARPSLIVTAAPLPEPMATSLLAAGAMLLMGRCRKR